MQKMQSDEFKSAMWRLEKAGYTVRPMKIGGRIKYLAIGETSALLPIQVSVEKGMVDRDNVTALLKAKGFDEWGYKIP